MCTTLCHPFTPKTMRSSLLSESPAANDELTKNPMMPARISVGPTTRQNSSAGVMPAMSVAREPEWVDAVDDMPPSYPGPASGNPRLGVKSYGGQTLQAL